MLESCGRCLVPIETHQMGKQPWCNPHAQAQGEERHPLQALALWNWAPHHVSGQADSSPDGCHNHQASRHSIPEILLQQPLPQWHGPHHDCNTWSHINHPPTDFCSGFKIQRKIINLTETQIWVCGWNLPTKLNLKLPDYKAETLTAHSPWEFLTWTLARHTSKLPARIWKWTLAGASQGANPASKPAKHLEAIPLWSRERAL